MKFPCRICTAARLFDPAREVKPAEFHLEERGWYLCEEHFDTCQRLMPILEQAARERKARADSAREVH